MLNIEKYRNEIEAEIRESSTLDCAVCSLRGGVCDKNYVCTGHHLESLYWLLQEYKEPILTEEEKEYLNSFIKPFKNKISSISKISGDRIYYIEIRYENDDPTYFPFFEENENMYRGMVADKEYTLEELGL